MFESPDFRSVLFSAGLCFMMLTGCQVDKTPSLYDPDLGAGNTPVITSIEPAGGTLAGVGEVTINGSHFSTTAEENLVFFDTELGTILSASPTQLIVKVPNVMGDSIEVKIAVQGTELFSDIYLYRLIPAVRTIGTVEEDEQGFGIAFDITGDCYVSLTSKRIKKITPDGQTTVFIPSTTFLKANNMRMGPNNTLYAAVAAGRIKKIATIDASGTEGTFVSLSESPQDLDFDSNGNLWVAAGSQIVLVKPDQSVSQVLSFSVPLWSLRVYNGYVYVHGMDPGGSEAKIWRSEIQGESLGTAEPVLDVSAAAWLNGAQIQCFTFSQDGEMVIGTDRESDAVFLYSENDGNHEILYPGLIEPAIYAMSWNEGNLIYAVRQFTGEEGATSQILRIDMGKPGAPYYGRQ